MSRRILLIEEEYNIARLVEIHLKDLGCEVIFSFDGKTGLEMAESRSWDMIILDMRLTGLDGMEICRQLRKKDSYIPIMMLTAKSSELDSVIDSETGADDYLAKPFSVAELQTRVNALFSRIRALKSAGRSKTRELIKAGNLVIDLDKRKTFINGTPVNLTVKEFDLLVHFANHPGQVFTRSQLLDSVWNTGFEGYEHTVNSHINRLRTKIEEDPANPQYIITAWGVGYKFRE
jgi:DNA-binding response OmpR family regulator